MARIVVIAMAMLCAACRREPTAAELVAAADRDHAIESPAATRRAVEKYQRALALTPDKVARARILIDMADAYSICDATHVEATLRDAVRSATEAGDAGTALVARAWLAITVDQKMDARIAALRALLAEAQAAGARPAEALAGALLGGRLSIVRNANEAIVVLGHALEVVRAAPDTKTEQMIEWNLGGAYLVLGDADQALPHLERALALAHDAPLPLEAAQVAGTLGQLYRWLRKDRPMTLVLDNVDPDQSGLVFSQLDAAGAPVDGFVRVPDIEKASLAAQLVVLSACRTAIGKSFDREGLVGLTRAFLSAGVPRVVSSLWQVDDVATAALMARFYRGLISEGLPAPAALRRAQLAVAKRSAPRLWAAFAFYGDWR